MKSGIKLNKVGFWKRLLATWLDCVLIYLLLKGVFYLLVYTNPSLYFPFNFTFFIIGIVYSAVCISLWGQTAGKYFLNIVVSSKDGERLPFHKALLRESVLKILSGIILMLGFLWIGFSKKKMAWHDYLVQSIVLENDRLIKFAPIWKTVALVSFLLVSGNYLWEFFDDIIKAKKMNLVTNAISLPFMKRDTSSLIDIATIKNTSFINWVDSNSLSPEAYAVQMAATHQITLFGEMHENADNLIFLNKIIPALYYQSGIRVVAMEVISAEMNKKVMHLVNGKQYDSALALEIARTQCWKLWGFKEYWDVLKTVWQLNQSLPDTAEKMKLIGLDADWEMPNISLLGISGDSKGKSQFWEKFRVFSALKDLPKAAFRDNLMAYNLDKEVISKNKKAVVWIGINHTLMNFSPYYKKGNQTVLTSPRFAVLLNQRYPNKLFQIIMHQNLIFSDADTACNNSIVNFIDSVMQKRSNKPAGFTITASPFEKLKDRCLSIFTKYPGVCYGDITQGLIFLTPRSKRSQCAWMPGYISNEMFMKYKPMYDLLFGRNPAIKFKTATELNKTLVDHLTEDN
ncbi:MAG: RDD family protein [Chitinophagaceae bacterium]|nr:RDD family protein [Chitinophagaceae bacterium]